MRIPSFNVQNQRALRLAICDNVPPVMIITGPNGCGKSTLLNALRQAPGGTGPILYIGPHRVSRRQLVRMRYLAQQRIKMGDLLSANNVPGYEGMNLQSNERDAWNFDEAQSFLKYGLCNIEMDRSEAITSRFDKDGTVSRTSIPDVWQPLRELTANLLPHLVFDRVDMSNRDSIRCLWQVHQKDILVDIDDLSSGEKAVIQLFFPLIEKRIQDSLARLRGEANGASQSTAVLLDEPELHLHPNLQGKILDYMRDASLKTDMQFILATHSPTIVENANSDELYLLRPNELVTSGASQLMQIASDEERLAALREVFGSTSNITAMKRILVVEGKGADTEGRRTSDARIFGFLSPAFGQLTVVAGGGKSECRALVQRFATILSEVAPQLNAVALLDKDVEQEPVFPSELFLPVSMIENLLVDPSVIWEAISTVRHKTSFTSAEAIATALDAILDGLHGHEVSRRAKASFATKTFRLTEPLQEAQNQVDRFTTQLKHDTSESFIGAAIAKAQDSVAEVKSSKKRRELFDGKLIMDTFYKSHLHATGMSKEIFVYSCAKEAAKRRSVQDFVSALFKVVGIEEPSKTPSELAVGEA